MSETDIFSSPDMIGLSDSLRAQLATRITQVRDATLVLGLPVRTVSYLPSGWAMIETKDEVAFILPDGSTRGPFRRPTLPPFKVEVAAWEPPKRLHVLDFLDWPARPAGETE